MESALMEAPYGTVFELDEEHRMVSLRATANRSKGGLMLATGELWDGTERRCSRLICGRGLPTRPGVSETDEPLSDSSLFFG